MKIGYRVWRLTTAFSLGSTTWIRGSSDDEVVWNSGENKAVCLRGSSHRAAGQKCVCGFYVHKELWQCYMHAKSLLNPRLGVLIAGSALLWGQVTEHELVYRAEIAEVETVFDVQVSKCALCLASSVRYCYLEGYATALCEKHFRLVARRINGSVTFEEILQKVAEKYNVSIVTPYAEVTV